VSICAFAPFARRPVSISCALNLRPPFGFTGVGIMSWSMSGLSKGSTSLMVGAPGRNCPGSMSYGP